MPTGYCTADDVRRALRKANLPGDAAQDRDIVIDAIAAQTEWLQEQTNRHWYEPNGIDEDTDGLIPTAPLTHAEDEQDIPTRSFLTTKEDRFDNDDNTTILSAGTVSDGSSTPDYGEMDGLAPQQHAGPFTRVVPTRRDVQTLTELLVLTTDGYEDWVASSSYTEGRTGDYYVQSNDSTGLSRIYLHTDSLDPDLESYATAVVATYDYGVDTLPRTVRRAVAMRAAAELVTADDVAMGIPEDSALTSPETKVQALERQAEELLEIHQ